MAKRVALTIHVSLEVLDLLRDVAYARLLAQKGDPSVTDLIEELIKENLTEFEAEAEAVRGPDRPKPVRVGTKG